MDIGFTKLYCVAQNSFGGIQIFEEIFRNTDKYIVQQGRDRNVAASWGKHLGQRQVGTKWNLTDCNGKK